MDKLNLISVLIIFLNFYLETKSEKLYKPVRPVENYVQKPFEKTLYKVAPKDMQLRRFMWNDMGETMDDIYQGVSTGAQVMRQALVDAFMPVTRVKKHTTDELLEPQASETTSIRYIIRSPHKIMRIIKMPRNVIKIFTKPPPPPLPQPAALVMNSNAKNLPPVVQKFEVANMREIEKKEEKRVEEAMAELYAEGKINDSEPIITKGYSDGNIIKQTINELDDSWKPISKQEAPKDEQGVQPPKSYPVSSLHTDIHQENLAQDKPSASKHTYEVSEKIEEAEESAKFQTFSPIFATRNLKTTPGKTNKNLAKKSIIAEIRTTTEKPNYPENFPVLPLTKPKYNNEFNTETSISSFKLKKSNTKYPNLQSIITTTQSTNEKSKPSFKYSSKFKKISNWKPNLKEHETNSGLKTLSQDEFEPDGSEINPVSVGYRPTQSTIRPLIQKSWKRNEVANRGNKKFNIDVESLD